MKKNSIRKSESTARKNEMKKSISSDGTLKSKGYRLNSNKKRRMLSSFSLHSVEDAQDDVTKEVIRNVKDNIIQSISAESSILSRHDFIGDENWRGWIVVGNTRPIALLTSDTYIKKDAKDQPDVEDDILSRLVQVSSDTNHEVETSISVLPVKNLKVKVKQLNINDLSTYGSKFQQSSGASLFKGDTTGLRKGQTAEVYNDIISKYDLPEVHIEEGSQASSTELRIFRATVTLKKQPTCSLSEKSRERIFLMFSPSDDNVIDIMNNSQIKNKMLRHDIGKYLKPTLKRKNVGEVSQFKNAPLYVKRKLPCLVPVKEAGILKNYPPLTTEILFDQFFKEKVIQKKGYTILVKEQPLLLENITLCFIPNETISMATEKKKTGFAPHYTFKDREGENVPESEHPAFVRPVKLKPKVEQVIKTDKGLNPEEREALLVKSIVEGTFSDIPDLKQDLDEHLNNLSVELKKRVEPEVVEAKPKLQIPVEEEEEEPYVVPPKVIRSIWDKFELLGDKAKAAKQLISAKYDLMSKQQNFPDKKVRNIFDRMEEKDSLVQENNTVLETNGDKKLQSLSDVMVGEAEINLEDYREPSVIIRPNLEQILEKVAACKERLKKELFVPIVKIELPKHLLTGVKRFYQTDVQQYWSENHTDTSTFYHNFMDQKGQKCGKKVINRDRVVCSKIPAKTTNDVVEEIKEEVEIDEDEDNDNSDVEDKKDPSIRSKDSVTKLGGVSTVTNAQVAPAIITPSDVDEIKHELAAPVYTYSQDKEMFAGLAPSTYYKNSKKEIVAISYCDKFLKNYYAKNTKRRKLFLCVENEYGVQKIVSTTIKPTGLSHKELDTWQTISKFVSVNVNFVPLENPLYLPHILSSPGKIFEKGEGNAFELSTVLVSLLTGMGYDAYVVSGYANVLITQVEPLRNHLRYECPYLITEAPTDIFQTFKTKSRVEKNAEKARKPVKQSSNYNPSVAPYLDSSYVRQNKIDADKAKEDEILRNAVEDEEIACKKFLSFFEADELEGKRIHSWVLVIHGNRGIEKDFFLEPSSGFAYDTDDPYYYGIESLWNHQNYWINRHFTPYQKEKKIDTLEIDNTNGGDKEAEETSTKKKLEFDLTNSDIWLPLLANGPQIFKEEKGKRNKNEVKDRIGRLQKCLDMPFSWCGRISITTNQVENRINKPIMTTLYKRAICHEFQVGLNDDGLVAKITNFSDLPRTDAEYEVHLFERRRDLMYRRRRETVSDKLTEFFAFGRDDCLQSHEFIDGSDAMYCDHNIFFYWDFRDDGLMAVRMTDLYLKLEYGGRKDCLSSILVLYGSNIEEGRRGRKKSIETKDHNKTPRKEIQTIIQQFDPSSGVTPWTDFAKITYRITKGEVMVDFQYEKERITVTTKFIKKSHDDPELGLAQAEIANKKQDKGDDDDCLSEIDVENFVKDVVFDDVIDKTSEDEISSKSTNATQSDKKLKKNWKRGSGGNVSREKSSKKSVRDKADHEEKKKKADTLSSEESLKSSTKSKSSISEGSFGLSDHDCSSGDEAADKATFYPAKLEADKDKSMWACSRKTETFMNRKLLNSLFQSGPSKKNSLGFTNTGKKNFKSTENNKISGFNHLTKDSSHESSDEEEEYLKELKKRQIKAITETNELYKAIERDKTNPNINELTGLGKPQKIQVCELEDLVECVKHSQKDNHTIKIMKNKLNNHLHKESVYFPHQKSQNITHIQYEKTTSGSELDSSSHIQCDACHEMDCEDKNIESFSKSSMDKQPLKKKQHILAEVTGVKMNKNVRQKIKSSKKVDDKSNANDYAIDPLIIGIFTDSNRCIDDSLTRKRNLFSKSESKMKSMFNAFKDEISAKIYSEDEDSESQSVYKNDADITVSDEERANEKDIDSVEGDIYNSDDNYSMQSKNASSTECESSVGDGSVEEKVDKDTLSCQSENEFIIEYQTEAPTHYPYDFKGFHFQAGKMYARKLYQLKEVCDNIAIDSDQQSAYEGDDDYNAEFLQGEIDKFLDNTVDRITQDVREARHLIGGFKVASQTNLDQTGVYYCNLRDRYINYVDSYFRKINKKREVQTDKAYLLEMMKKKAKEPDKIIKHIREYISCKKYGIRMELDENLMNLIPHVRPVEVKKKDRLGYEILTDEDDDDDEVELNAKSDETESHIKQRATESIEPINITMAELVRRLEYSPNVPNLLESVNNLKKFKDMETVNQLIELPLHECFSDVNIRNHLQSSKVNDGYFIDATVDGKIRSDDGYGENLGFVTDPEHVVLSKDFDSLSILSESEISEEVKLKHMEILTNCGKETIKEADFFEPVYKTNLKCPDPFKPDKFRMFAPLDPLLLDSDSDGTINTRIRTKRRKAFRTRSNMIARNEDVSLSGLISEAPSDFSTISTQKKVETDKCYGLEPIIQKSETTCRVGVRNMSVNDEVSQVDKSLALEKFLSMEDDTINYVRNIEAYIHNLLLTRKKERQSTKRRILEMSRKNIRRENFQVFKKKLNEFREMADELSFDCDLLAPYLHLLLPQDYEKKFTFQTADYIFRLLVVDFIERELFKLKGLYKTYEEARKAVVEKKNIFMSELENLSAKEKYEFDEIVSQCNEKLRKLADRAHILRFVILRRAKQASKKFLKLINDIKNDERINRAYSKARERIVLMDIAKRWPEHFEFIHNFSGLPVASEPNDFTSSYVSPIEDIIYRKILKQIRKKPAKYMLADNTYERYLDLMTRDRDYFDGLKKKDKLSKKKKSVLSIYGSEKLEKNVDGKSCDFIDKLELVNDLDWTNFLFASDPDDEEIGGKHYLGAGSYFNFNEYDNTTYDVCTKSLLEELVMLQNIEVSQVRKRSTRGSNLWKKPIYSSQFEAEQTKKDSEFFEKYGTPEASKVITEKLPEYFQYI